MATYVGITDSQTDPDAPLTSELGKAWTDNVLAMFEGASGAPRLHGDAVGTIANSGLPILTVTAAATYSAATNSFNTTLGDSTTSGFSNVTAISYDNELYTGSMRFYLEQRHSDGTGVSVVDIFKNGGLVNSFSTSSTTAVQRSEDISIIPGDNVTWAHRISTGGGSSILGAINVFADEVYQGVTPLGRASLL